MVVVNKTVSSLPPFTRKPWLHCAKMATQQQGAFAYIISVDVGWPDMTWVEARNKCNEHGLSFAKVLSEDDQTKMRYKLLGFKKGVDDGIYTPSPDVNCKGGDPAEWPCGLWIGGNDREVEGTWKWTNGLLMSYYNFGGFDPSTGQVPGMYPWGSEASGATADEPNNWNKTAGFELGEDCARLDLESVKGSAIRDAPVVGLPATSPWPRRV